MPALGDYTQRKSLLAAQADLQRMQVAFAWREVRAIVAPAVAPERSAWARPKVAAFLSVALPLIGARRLGRVVRFLSFGLMTLRIARNWRAR
jgi:hypothetical protein